MVGGAGPGECRQPRRGAGRGQVIAERGVKAMEALHVASAITAGASWLLTTDIRLIRKMCGDDRIVVADPIDFIRHWQGDADENRL